MICRFCGQDSKGIEFNKWVKPTFTNHDELLPGEIVCNDCLFWFDEANTELAKKLDKEKPQRMRNYSHFIVNGEWIPLSKKDKSRMVDLLLSDNFPEMAVISESGQKHIVFRAKRNDKNSKSGWIQFEEHSLWINPNELKLVLETIECLMAIFSKTEIQYNRYKSYRILEFGIDKWRTLESKLKPIRNSLLFNLSLFLTQRKEENGRSGSKSIRSNVGRDSERLQEQVSEEYLGAIRKCASEQRLHKQSGEVYQQSLFET